MEAAAEAAVVLGRAQGGEQRGQVGDWAPLAPPRGGAGATFQGRPLPRSEWANPCRTGAATDREAAIAQYAEHAVPKVLLNLFDKCYNC